MLNYKSLFFLARKAEFARKVGYKPHSIQADFHTDTHRYLMLIAGARGGKSMAVGFELAYALLYPDTRCWVVGKTYQLADKEFDWALHFLSEYELSTGEKLIDLAKVSNPARGQRQIKFPWGSWLQTKSSDDMVGLLGEELDIIAIGEAAVVQLIAWLRFLKPRLGSRLGRLLLGSTPSGDSGLLKFLSDMAKDKKFPDYMAYYFRTIDNPTFSQQEWENAKKEIPEEDFAEQYEGKFISRSGAVINGWEKCVLEISEVPKNLRNMGVLRAWKVGYKNFFIVLWVVIDTKHNYHVLKCYAEKNKGVSEVVQEITKKFVGYNIVADIISPFSKSKLLLKTNGLNCYANETEKELGKQKANFVRIQALQRIVDADRLKIYDKSCPQLIVDLENCRWTAPPKEGSDKEIREEPLPKFFRSIEVLTHIVAFTEKNLGDDIYKKYLDFSDKLKPKSYLKKAGSQNSQIKIEGY